MAQSSYWSVQIRRKGVTAQILKTFNNYAEVEKYLRQTQEQFGIAHVCIEQKIKL